jgi:hypothetical protein
MFDARRFWEQPKPGAEPAGFGRILPAGPMDYGCDRERATIASRHRWVDWTGRIHIDETRETVVHAPVPDGCTIDTTISLRPHEGPVRLDLKRGDPGKGGLYYSGLTVRFDNAMTPGRVLDSEGRTDASEIYGSSARWCCATARSSTGARRARPSSSEGAHRGSRAGAGDRLMAVRHEVGRNACELRSSF